MHLKIFQHHFISFQSLSSEIESDLVARPVGARLGLLFQPLGPERSYAAGNGMLMTAHPARLRARASSRELEEARHRKGHSPLAAVRHGAVWVRWGVGGPGGSYTSSGSSGWLWPWLKFKRISVEIQLKFG